jgi:hypothetical protein
MRRQTLHLRFEPRATEPEGQPPTFVVNSGPASVSVVDGDPDGAPTAVSYHSQVRLTGATTLVEEGTMILDGGELRFSTLGEGLMEPSPADGFLRGAVLWRVEGTGRLAGATGLVSSCFVHDTVVGAGVEHQILQLFRR